MTNWTPEKLAQREAISEAWGDGRISYWRYHCLLLELYTK